MAPKEKVCVIGLGYVGLPVALAFAEKFPGTLGFDISSNKIKQLKEGVDPTGELSPSELNSVKLTVTDRVEDLRDATFFVVAVPTPVDAGNIPDLAPLIKASETVGKVLKKGDVVVYESTVYPGVTEEVCAPVLARVSGLDAFKDFQLGYSPERINPGDKQRTLKKIVKVVAGQDQVALERIADAYGEIIEAGVFRARSIKVAEAAKVIENTQRDLNIALMNELSLIFDRLSIRTSDVLEAASTKWNFLPFKPGLVGGHCIGVDPYYLTHKAISLGYQPEVILAGRRINDNMGQFIAQKTVKLLMKQGLSLTSLRVGILGLTFKENVSDIRNSKIPSIVHELAEFGIKASVFDPLANWHEAKEEYGLELEHEAEMREMDALILAVPHDVFMLEKAARVISKVKKGGVLIDVKASIAREAIPAEIAYWAL